MKNLWKKMMVLLVIAAFLVGCGKSAKTEETNIVETEEVTEGEAETAEDKEAANSYSVDGTPSAKLVELREAGVLYAGSSGDAPFAYIDQETGEFSGVDAEIIKEVGKRLGIASVEMKLIPFSELILNVNSGNIDIITDCMYIREDRAEQIYFGEIWYTQGGGLLVTEASGINGESEYNSESTVIGFTPGTVWQVGVEALQAEGKIKEARATGDQSESIVALQNGKIDAFLTDSTVLENLFANHPDTVNGLKMAENYEDEPDAIGRIAPSVSFDDIEFMREVDAVVAELREEGFIDKVFEDYKLDPKLHAISNDERTHDINTREE